MLKLCSLALSLAVISCSQTIEKHASSLPNTLSEALSSPLRSPENIKRDKYRHPQETLEFFGLKPGMTVIEITPGAGWYTEILAPYLARSGKYIMAVPPLTKDSPAYAKINEEKVRDILARHPTLKERTVTAPFDPLNQDITAPETADLVVTFRNVHNWLGTNSAQTAFRAFYRALKPGGALGVVEHRSRSNRPDPKSGYMTEEQVIALATEAGFFLEARSEINANPLDTTVHPEGVWTLPPTYRLGENDRKKYEAIGESDRMTLRFRKPQK